MEEQFYENKNHSKKELIQKQMVKSDSKSILLFSVQYGLLVASALIVSLGWYRNGWQLWAALFVFGLMTMSMFALGHETVHKTAFQTEWLNEVVLWLACIPIFYIPTNFRQFHFAHHRFTHDPQKDPEIAVAGKPVPAITSGVVVYLAWLTGLPLLLYKIMYIFAGSVGMSSWIWENVFFFANEKSRATICREARILLFFHLSIFVIAWMWLPALFLLWIGQAIGHAMLAFYLVTEHNELPYEGSIFERTRTTQTSWLVRHLMWNMPYHAEHHAYPAVPWHALPELNQLLQEDLVHVGKGYPSFHRRIWNKFLGFKKK